MAGADVQRRRRRDEQQLGGGAVVSVVVADRRVAAEADAGAETVDLSGVVEELCEPERVERRLVIGLFVRGDAGEPQLDPVRADALANLRDAGGRVARAVDSSR